MKRLFLTVNFIILGAICLANAQPRAIGGRLGPNVELSFQQSISDNMLQVDIGVAYFQGIQSNITYNWASSTIGNNAGGTWTSYAGFGIGGGYSWRDNSWYSSNRGSNRYLYKYVTFGVVGMIGIEYAFSSIPLALSLDYRPLIGADFGTRQSSHKFGIQYHLPGLWSCGLSARYIF
ncbi:MAG: hypothetical protein LBS16_04835 [Prevotellaceae bacterium]|nr:hypothetical protein [Prevotellaceae bacterium]